MQWLRATRRHCCSAGRAKTTDKIHTAPFRTLGTLGSGCSRCPRSSCRNARPQARTLLRSPWHRLPRQVRQRLAAAVLKQQFVVIIPQCQIIRQAGRAVNRRKFSVKIYPFAIHFYRSSFSPVNFNFAAVCFFVKILAANPWPCVCLNLISVSYTHLYFERVRTNK